MSARRRTVHDVPSAPTFVDEEIAGIRVFEKLSALGHPRRCSPFATSWLETYRGVADGRTVVVVVCPRRDLRSHAIDADAAAADDGRALFADALAADAAAWARTIPARAIPAVRAVSWPASSAPAQAGAPVACVTFAGMGGVRLRAILDATAAAGALLAPEVVLDVALRTLAAVRTLDAPNDRLLFSGWSDTMIGFDGVVRFFPDAPRCRQAEEPSYVGNEVFDPLTLTTSNDLHDAFTGAPPAPLFGLVPPGTRAPLPPGLPPVVRRIVENDQLDWAALEGACARALDELGRPPPALVGEIAQRLFPEIHQRQREVEEQLLDVE